MRPAPLSASAETVSPALVLAAHGSPHPAHLPSLVGLRDAVREAFRSPSISAQDDQTPATVELGWLDFAEPDLATCVRAAATRSGRRRSMPAVVVVPLLLTSGYHARVDIPTMVQGVDGVVVTAALGPDRAIARALLRRLEAAGVADSEDVVLGAAGSADEDALRDVEEAAALLAALRSGAVDVGYVTGAGPRLDTVLTGTGSAARAQNGAAAIATYLLADGSMADAIRDVAADRQRAGGIALTEPLGAAPEVVDLVTRRWFDALRSLQE